jgi:transcription-repair coupling factor (superfamily II helicase)
MPERQLEHVMRDFVAQRFNLLLCSTIIETGIDVPTANTIVISRADKFGLAQLHQLRGRVGRSHHQAYAYLLVPDVEGLTKQAAQRLQAIQDMEELGSAASTSPCTTWRSAAPARCWARTRAAT